MQKALPYLECIGSSSFVPNRHRPARNTLQCALNNGILLVILFNLLINCFYLNYKPYLKSNKHRIKRCYPLFAERSAGGLLLR